MDKVYVVWGSTGEYSDHTEWHVKAFADEEKAKDLVLKASARARELKAKYPEYWDIPDGSNEYDPKFQSDYTGTNYGYETVPFES